MATVTFAAAFGVIGLETSCAAALTYLYHANILTPVELIRKMSLNPNRILNLSGGTLSIDSLADITIIDPQRAWRVDPACFYSKSKNTPFNAMDLKGYCRYTIMGGRIVYERKPMKYDSSLPTHD